MVKGPKIRILVPKGSNNSMGPNIRTLSRVVVVVVVVLVVVLTVVARLAFEVVAKIAVVSAEAN